ncbi:MAG TPA: hypothetical protein VG405_08855 [Solirubrobacteraceae bacterium]|jgi:hypothetical protein|nr:hypothetical protein [Solirubrobacteraceae bacterium]
MRFYTIRRAWTSLLVVGVPVSVLALIWSAFMGGRASVAALAFVYLLLVACGRAQAIKQERDERPYREKRVEHQLARIRSTLPGAEESYLRLVDSDEMSHELVGTENKVAVSERAPVESLTLRAV